MPDPTPTPTPPPTPTPTPPPTPIPTPTVPSEPLGVSCVGRNGQAILSWAPPESDGNSPITGYTVYWESDSSQTFLSTTTTQTISPLDNFMSYTFQVAAINSVGTGPKSLSSNTVIPSVLLFSAPDNSGNVEVIGYNQPAPSGELGIQGDACDNSVTSVASSALQSLDISAVFMPNVTTVGTESFYSCQNLTLIGANSLEQIGAGAFRRCTSLPYISLPSTTRIGSLAFNNCSALKKVFLGLINVSDVSSNAFDGVDPSMSIYVYNYPPSSLWPSTWTETFFPFTVHNVYKPTITADTSANLHLDTTGFTTGFSYQWQVSTDGIVFMPIPDASGSSYTPQITGRYQVLTIYNDIFLPSNIIEVSIVGPVQESTFSPANLGAVLSWRDPSEGIPPFTYSIKIGSGPFNVWGTSSPSNSYNSTVLGLTAGQQYLFTIRAASTNGVGVPYDVVNYVTPLPEGETSDTVDNGVVAVTTSQAAAIGADVAYDSGNINIKNVSNTPVNITAGSVDITQSALAQAVATVTSIGGSLEVAISATASLSTGARTNSLTEMTVKVPLSTEQLTSFTNGLGVITVYRLEDQATGSLTQIITQNGSNLLQGNNVPVTFLTLIKSIYLFVFEMLPPAPAPAPAIPFNNQASTNYLKDESGRTQKREDRQLAGGIYRGGAIDSSTLTRIRQGYGSVSGQSGQNALFGSGCCKRC